MYDVCLTLIPRSSFDENMSNFSVGDVNISQGCHWGLLNDRIVSDPCYVVALQARSVRCKTGNRDLAIGGQLIISYWASEGLHLM